MLALGRKKEFGLMFCKEQRHRGKIQISTVEGEVASKS
jgi:hypothetical protein